MSRYDERDEHAVAWAVRLSERPLSDSEQADFQSWLGAESGNADALSEILGVWEVVDHYDTAEPMMELREEALASSRRTRSRTAREAAEGISDQKTWGLIAACLCLVVAGIFAWYTQQPDVYTTGQGERQIVVLDDSSKLSLDADTTVKVRYSGKSRQLWLEQGRAKFDVAKDPLRPFSVAVRGKLVVATGTEFSVELLGPETRVILYDGHVAVIDRGTRTTEAANKLFSRPQSDQSDYLAMDAGNELIVTEAHTNAGAVTKRRPTIHLRKSDDLDTSADWETGQLVFENETLAVVAQRTNRYAAKPLTLGDDAVGQLRVSGVFRAGDTETLVEGLTATLGITARDDGRTITLKSSKELKSE